MKLADATDEFLLTLRGRSVPITHKDSGLSVPFKIPENATADVIRDNVMKAQEAVKARGTELFTEQERQRLLKEDAESRGFVESAVIGAGKEFTDLVRGGRMLLPDIIGGNEEELAAEHAESDRLFNPLQEARPGATFLGESLPLLAVPFGAVTKPVAAGVNLATRGGRVAGALADDAAKLMFGANPRLATRAAATGRKVGRTIGNSRTLDAAATGAAIGALDPDLDAATGAATGVVGQKLVGAALNRLSKPANNLSREANRVVAKARDRLGIKFTPGELTGDVTQQRVDSALRSNTATGEVVSDVIDKSNQVAVNRTAAKAIGQEGHDKLDATVLADAFEDVTTRMSNLVEGTRFQMTANDLKDIIAERSVFRSRIGFDADAKPAQDKFLADTVDRVAAAFRRSPNGVVDGKAYQEISSELSTAIRDLTKAGASATVHEKAQIRHLINIKNKFDDMVERADPKVIQRWKKARKQFAHLKMLEDSDAVNFTTGDVDLGKLSKKVRRDNATRRRLTLGEGESDFELLAKVEELQRGSRHGGGLSTSQMISDVFSPGGARRRARTLPRSPLFLDAAVAARNRIPFLGRAGLHLRLSQRFNPTVNGPLGPLSLTRDAIDGPVGGGQLLPSAVVERLPIGDRARAAVGKLTIPEMPGLSTLGGRTLLSGDDPEDDLLQIPLLQ